MCIALAGVALLPLLPIKLSPSHALPGLTVHFSMPRNSSRVVEMQATSKLEAMLSRVNGIKNIYSRSGNGWGRIDLELDKHTSIDLARFEASTIVRQTWQDLPRSVTYPYLTVRRPDEKAERPFMTYTLNSSTLPIVIQNYAINTIKPQLSDIKGIYKIEITGATPMEWQLEYDATQLNTLQISLKDIQNAIQLQYRSEFLGMGNIKNNQGNTSLMRVVLAPDTENDNLDLAAIFVKNKQGETFRLDRLLKMKRVAQAARSHYRINGLNSIYLSITAEETANQLNLSKEIKQIMQQVEQELPFGYELHQSYDATEYIKDELDKIYIRSGLTILILLIFVFVITRNLRYLFLIIVSLVVNLSIAVILYYFFNLEIQLYSLAGITISLSLIIDNTIIMTDHLMHRSNRKVFLPTLAATLTTVGALSVIFFLEEKIRLNLQDFAAVVMINLMVSLFIALFFVPALVEKIRLKKRVSKKKKSKSKRRIIYFNRFYSKFIQILSRRKWITYTLIILLFGLPTFLIPERIETKDGEEESTWATIFNSTLGSDYYKNTIKPYSDIVLGGALRLFVENVYDGRYFSRNGETVLSVTASMPNGTTLPQINNLIMKMESYLTSFPEIKQFQTNISSARRAYIRIFFTKEAEKSSFPYQLKSNIISKALQLGGGSWGVYGLQDHGFNNDVREQAGNLRIKMLGYNYDQLYIWADTLKQRLLKYRRIKDVTVNSDFNWFKQDYKEFVFDLNKQRLAASNISPFLLFQSLSDVFAKDVFVENLIVDSEIEAIRLNSLQSVIYDIWALQNIGRRIDKNFYKLGELASIKKEQAPQEVAKENQQYRLAIQFSYIGASKQGDKVLRREIEKLNKTMPMGYTAQPEGWTSWWNPKSKKQYWLLVLLVLIIFFTTSVLFNSIKQPFNVILIIPISFIGVFLTFYLFDLNFDQGGFASFILLSGITVNASIYIVNEYNNIKKHQPQLHNIRIYLKAWNSKIIPILLTIISTILGFIPFLVGLDKESFWFPLAAGTIGGLIMSIVGIFLFLPLFLLRRK